MRRYSILYIIMCTLAIATAGINASAINWGHIRFGNEERDTTLMVEIMKKASTREKVSSLKYTPGMLLSDIGHSFIGTPYVAHTLECDTAYAFSHRAADGSAGEMLTIDLGALDCTTFVETAMAMAYTIGEGRSGWRDAMYNLEKIRYRHGVMNGYASRLHYICDWIMDNSAMGIIEDAVRRMDTGVKYEVKTIDYMSTHRDSYPVMADSVTYERIRDVEDGYRNHRFGYLKARSLGDKSVQAQLREGDILCFTSTLKDLDVTHLGILTRGDDGKWHVMHASSTLGKVVVSDETIDRFVQRNRHWTGVRVLRLRE